MNSLPVIKNQTDCLKQVHKTTKISIQFEKVNKPSFSKECCNFWIKFGLFLLLIVLQLPTQIRKTFKSGSGNSVEFCDALKMINLDVPQTALAGDTIKLSCFYSLTADSRTDVGPDPIEPHQRAKRNLLAEKTDVNSKWKSISNYNDLHAQHTSGSLSGEILYAIKWYKEEKEFYRYLAQEWPHKQVLPLDGVQVDINKSDNQSVVLKSVSLQTSGLYKCEVSTDAPNFITKSIERKLAVYSLPSGGPQINSINVPNPDRYSMAQRSNMRQVSIGDQIQLQCVAPETKPTTQIDWIINETLNLSAIVPINSRGLPMFELTHHRLTSLPLQMNVDHLLELSSRQNQKHSSRRNHSRFHTKPKSLSILSSTNETNLFSQRSHTSLAGLKSSAEHNIYADFEIIESKQASRSSGRGAGTIEAIKAIPRMHSVTIPSSLGNFVLPTITLSSRTLDQILETSTSTLNFTIDSDLVQLLFAPDRNKDSQMSIQSNGNVDTNLREGVDLHKYTVKSQVSSETLSSDASLDKRQSQGYFGSPLSSSKYTPSISQDGNTSPDTSIQSTSNSFRTTTFDRRGSGFFAKGENANSSTKFGNTNKTIIHIKCIARVLSLHMFDELRVVVLTNRFPSKSATKQERLIKNTPIRPLRKILIDNERNCALTFKQNIHKFVLIVTLARVLLQIIVEK